MKPIYLSFLAITFLADISIAQDENSASPTERMERMPATLETKDGTPSASKLHQKAKSDAALEDKRASLGELERLAVTNWHAPSREEVAPFRFQDTSRLQQMLKDKDWVEYWSPIVFTIAMVADKKGTLGLIDYIRDSNVPTGCEKEANGARLKAIGALSRTTVDQNVPEVIEFLSKLTDEAYVKSLKFSHRATVVSVRQRAFLALSLIGSDDSIAILEKLKQKTQASLLKSEIHAFSAKENQSSQQHNAADDLALLESYLEEARNRRAGL